MPTTKTSNRDSNDKRKIVKSADDCASAEQIVAACFAKNPGYHTPLFDWLEVIKALTAKGLRCVCYLDKKKPDLLSEIKRKDTFEVIVEQACKQCSFGVVTGKPPLGVLGVTQEMAIEAFRRKHGLASVLVEPSIDSHTLRKGEVPSKMAERAAKELKYLIKTCVLAKGRPDPMVGIGGGRTLSQITEYFQRTLVSEKDSNVSTSPQTHSFRSFISFPLNYTSRYPEDDMVDSAYLAMHLHWYARQRTHQVINLPPFPHGNPREALFWHRHLCDMNPRIMDEFKKCSEKGLADIAFIGMGAFESDATAIKHVMDHVGISYEELESHVPKPVGDINFSYFDANGDDLMPGILAAHIEKHRMTPPEDFLRWAEGAKPTLFPNLEYSHPFLIGHNLQYFREMVKDGRSVVMVAGENGKKVEGLRALLKSKEKVFNRLITDVDTFIELNKDTLKEL